MSLGLNLREPSAKYLVKTVPLLLRNFELFATAPDAASELRKLILRLAVKGSLGTHAAGDETTLNLLKRLGATAEIDCARNLARDSGNSFPPTWVPIFLEQIGKWAIGAGFPIAEQGKTGLPILFAKVSDMNRPGNEREIESTAHTIDPDTARRLRINIHEPGTVIFPKIGGAIATNKRRILTRPTAIDNNCLGITPNLWCSTEYLFLLLQSIDFTAYQAGTSVPALSQGVLGKIIVGLPPFAEQLRIVACVDELMKLCDALETRGRLADEQHARLTSTLFNALAASESAQALAENWQRIAEHFDLLLDRPEAIDALEQTILELAVRGKLVPQEVGCEPAQSLLARLRSKQSTAAKKQRTAIVEECEIEVAAPFELPSGWAWAKFPELGTFGRGKSKHRPRNDPALFSPGIYPLVQTGEVARADRVINEFHSLYSEIGLAQSRLWPKGTMCITIAANIADVATLGFDACFPDSVVGFIPDKEIGDASYFSMFVETARSRLIEFAPATAQKNINLEVLESLQIPLPPLLEMKRIVARAEELRQLCDQLRARLASARQIQSKLADALVAEIAQ